MAAHDWKYPNARARLRRGLGHVRRRMRPAFERSLLDHTQAISLDMRRDSRTVLVAFGGRPGGMGMPPFEFFNMTRDIHAKRMFVRDVHQAWYHEGIPGAGSTVPEMTASLAGLLARQEVERMVVTGISAGGYAALLFGTLLGADRVIAFSPQTAVDPAILHGLGDHRYDDPLVELAAEGRLQQRWADLREALPRARCTATRYDVHYDPASQLDRGHVERLGALEGLTLFRHHGAGHNIPRVLRERGELGPMLLEALATRTGEERHAARG